MGGHLRPGDPGVRLIEAKGEALWFSEIPAPFHTAASQFKVVPFYHLFGSEENSAKAAPVQERIPQTYVTLAKSEADRLGVNEGAIIRLTAQGPGPAPAAACERRARRRPGRSADGSAWHPAGVMGAVAEGLQEAAQ